MYRPLCQNGGYTIWVSEAFGKCMGFQEGYWSWISGVVDNAIYPVLAMNYLLKVLNPDSNPNLN